MASPGESSQGQAYLPLAVPMRVPHLELIYRMDAEMGNSPSPIGAPFNASQTRTVLPIQSGQVRGPKHLRDACTHERRRLGHDSARCRRAYLKFVSAGVFSVDKQQFMQLNARYTIQTDDGSFVYVQSKGNFSGGPGQGPATGTSGPPKEFTQDQVEWFTRLKFEATGRYNWMNGIFTIGVLSMYNKRIVIDAYRVTNFPGVPARDIQAS